LLHETLHFFGRAICHQLEDRSLIVSGEALAVCARDTGIYLGIFSTLIYLHFSKRGKSISIPSIKTSFFLLLFLAPLMIDGLGSYSNLFESNNLRRLITGMGFGYVLPYFIYPLLSTRSLDKNNESVVKNNKDLFIPVIIIICFGVLFYFGQPSHLVQDIIIIVSLLGWFSLLASFLFPFIRRVSLRLTFSILTSFTFLSILSIAHGWILSFAT
jgi:uncharacterized membrane protein